MRRVSLGSGPARATLALLGEIGREVLDHGTYRSLERAIPYGRPTGRSYPVTRTR